MPLTRPIAPYRALIGDSLPEHQHGKGFALQTVFIGLGAFLGAMVPKALSLAGMSNKITEDATPVSVRLSVRKLTVRWNRN